MLRTGFRTVPGKHKWTLFQNNSRNSSQEQLIGKHHMETSKQPWEQPWEQFWEVSSICSDKSIIIQAVQLVKQESLVLHLFFFLICQLEDLDLSFTLKWFFFLKYFRMRTGFKLFSSQKTAQTNHVFILDFGLAFLGYFG